eukprot:12212197-Ditylum_brightwellii.AAC.1
MSHLIYIRIHQGTNSSIFHCNLVLQDNGIITVGSVLRLLSPHQIDENMQGIPLICTNSPAVALHLPTRLATVNINTNIQGSQSFARVWNGATLSINQPAPMQTTYSRIGGSNIAFMHTIVATNDNADVIYTRTFSSTKFNKLFLNGDIAASALVTSLEHTEASGDIKDAIENCIDVINENGGFTVVFWYS